MSEELQENVQTDPNKKRQRKKRKNFIANAKKYAKKGQLGRGTKMPEELYQYFVGILDAIKAGINDEEERHVLVNNVLERTKGEELNVIGNQLGCRVIELLLPYSSDEDLERYMEAVSPDLRKLCSDNFTSHVVETLLRVACSRATDRLQTTNDDEEVPKKKRKKDSVSKHSEEHINNCNEFTLKICKYVLNNLEDFVWDSYANHILRSALKSLSGITLLPGEKPKVNLFKETVESKKGIPPHLTAMTYRIVPEEYMELVKEFANRLASWPQFKDLAYQNLTSGLLQVLLYAVKNVDKGITKTLVRKLLDESFAPEDWAAGDDIKEEKDKENLLEKETDLPPVFASEPAVRLLEAALFVCKRKSYTQLYARCFLARLPRLAARPALNFTVQRLLDNCTRKEEFEAMFSEVSPGLGAALSAGNSGVLVALAKGCLRLGVKQAHYITALEEVLSVPSAPPGLLAAACLRLTAADKLGADILPDNVFIHVHGSVIMQTVLQFQRPAKAVSSILDLQPNQLVTVFSDAKGSHVADALVSGQYVGVKSRDKLIYLLRGYYQKLALSQYGTRAFEHIFEAASVEQKVRIMTEITDKIGLLQASAAGRKVSELTAAEMFKNSRSQWDQWLARKKGKEVENKEN